MLIPLYVLAAGSLLAGYLFKDYFFGADEALFWSNSIYRRPENEIVHELHKCRWSVKQLPTGNDGAGFGDCDFCSTSCVRVGRSGWRP